MSDRWALALAAAAAAGALRPSAFPVFAALALLVAARLARRPRLLCVGLALLTSGLGQRALDGLHGVTAGPVRGEVTLLSDPEPAPGGVRAEVRLGHHRFELRASGSLAGEIEDHLAGERIVVGGDVVPDGARSPWLVTRHLAGRLTAVTIEPGRPPGAVSALANGLRRTLVAGARPFDAVQRSLFTGLVLGDDREQPATLTDDFQGAGLTHLLAVSGQNVAFVLSLLGPLARRLRLWPRLGLTLAVIGLFALMTRFEPSVSRASVMAALAAATVTAGRPTARVRVLALAVTALLVIDPLLVRSLGFQLSVAASLAIITVASRVAAVLPGPAWCTEPLGVTVAAQLGVSPLLLIAFGPIPLASVPANLLAVPAAGAVMAWGMTGGLVAGLAGGRLAPVLHLPTRALLMWIQGVAARAAAAPLGVMGVAEVAAAVVGIALLVLARRFDRRALRRLGRVVVVGAVFVTVILVHAPPALRTELQPGVVRWHGGGTEVVVLGGSSWRSPVTEEVALEALRRGGVRAIDLLVVVSRDVPAATIAAVMARHPTGTVLVAPERSPDDLPPGAVVAPTSRADLAVGSLRVLLAPGEGRLVVEAWPSPR